MLEEAREKFGGTERARRAGGSARRLPFAAFMSYAHDDDEHDCGQLTLFRDRLKGEVKAVTGKDFMIFQDQMSIGASENWRQRIDAAIDDVTLFLAFMTPNFFNSHACRNETERFLERERKLGLNNLIIPIYYISVPEIDNEAPIRRGQLVQRLAERQYTDWRELRFEDFMTSTARRAMNGLALRIRDLYLAIESPALIQDVTSARSLHRKALTVVDDRLPNASIAIWPG